MDQARDEQPKSPAPKDDEPMLWCPRCNAKLTASRCKLMCERCGYFMSCADYY